MSALADKIMKRIRGKGRGWVFTPKDFIDFGTRGAVDMALMRLTRSDAIRHVGRGLYDYPKLHAKLGALSPNTDSLAQAVSTQSGDKIFSSGAVAANRLGLSTQVPARATYATSGPSRIKNVAGRTLALRHARVPLIDGGSDRANAVVQAMAHLGKGNIDTGVIQRLARRLDDRDMKALHAARPQMPGWMADLVLKIGQTRHG